MQFSRKNKLLIYVGCLGLKHFNIKKCLLCPHWLTGCKPPSYFLTSLLHMSSPKPIYTDCDGTSCTGENKTWSFCFFFSTPYKNCNHSYLQLHWNNGCDSTTCMRCKTRTVSICDLDPSCKISFCDEHFTRPFRSSLFSLSSVSQKHNLSVITSR